MILIYRGLNFENDLLLRGSHFSKASQCWPKWLPFKKGLNIKNKSFFNNKSFGSSMSKKLNPGISAFLTAHSCAWMKNDAGQLRFC